ncbi:malate synthase A [Solirubrobacter ginsenosidimutans]|uniref:Malate synthase n=1 Tax=Solirubrobacter ginsenosidimutans TaxID=490573 RepID=A0A9X3N3G0_9ACTN|nr:malate synthase A [Solirubrobacter ginsenosidimutans]MDA0164138.1 malate synthase A [Solirubrobacter ginsenosidimutans]
MKVQAAAPPDESLATILSDEALAFVGELQERFGARRAELLQARAERGTPTGFLAETEEIRRGDWQVPPPRPDYENRRAEITGPTDRKLVINALNSGAKGFMADFEDANSPTWRNQVEGHRNLMDAIDGTITYDGADGRHYELVDAPATLLVRPRGWHLPEKHLTIGGEPVAGAFMDFGLYAFHSGPLLAARDKGLYLYLPKLEHWQEAALWNDVFRFTREALGLPPGLIRATVLIETLPAAFQMAEIIHALGEHSYGLNAGRWDYIFSMIKVFRDDPSFVLPDRNDVKMTVPFMRAYSELLVKTCHEHGAFAMGGMAALIPSRKDEEANQRALDAVKADKEREAKAGFDGTWVAHPDVVDVALAAFEEVLGDRPNQIDKQRYDVNVSPEQLLDAASTPGEITEEGLRADVNVGFQYISFWLGGRGAAGINNLMEDAATAEISRSQIWQWVRHGKFDREHVRQVLQEEMDKIHAEVGDETWEKGRPEETRAIFERVALSDEFPEFLTLPAYEYID